MKILVFAQLFYRTPIIVNVCLGCARTTTAAAGAAAILVKTQEQEQGERVYLRRREILSG